MNRREIEKSLESFCKEIAPFFLNPEMQKWLKQRKIRNDKEVHLLNAHYAHRRRERMVEESKRYDAPFDFFEE